MRQPLVGEGRDLGGKADGRRRRGLEEGVVKGQFLHLLGGDIGELGAAIADVDAPQPRHAIENTIAVAVINITALGMRDDPAAAHILDQLIILLRGQMMRDIEAFEFGNIIVASHKFILVAKAARRGVRDRAY